ncbi:VTT domain-containing protein [Nannocystis sp.]|uniref:TVP38/TMEM64 family protein n=1 Tax=Nannocystis sp. TaxID=1962667 RepID=UPI0025E7B732|nr:VTT domain-containing protein [Nannocystis sp.]MBK7826218.1 TVP38/TMEM64 family protein [Nannocystis sp.]
MTASDPAASQVSTASRRRIVILALVGAVLALVLAADTLFAPLERLLAVTERIIAANPTLGAALFVLFAALSGMLAFFSSAVIVPVAVYAWGPVWSAVLLWLGWILGGASTYALGRFLGRPVAGALASKGLARYEKKINRDTPFGVVILFQMAMPSEVPGYLLGVVRYSFLRYIAVVAVGELPYAVGTVILGDSFVQRSILPFVVLGVAAALFSRYAYVLLQRRLAAAPPTSPEPAPTAPKS